MGLSHVGYSCIYVAAGVAPVALSAKPTWATAGNGATEKQLVCVESLLLRRVFGLQQERDATLEAAAINRVFLLM
jgi:hypothetical protein